MYTGAHACRPVRASGFTGPIGIPISWLVRRVDGITEGYSVMGSYVRTGPRAFQQYQHAGKCDAQNISRILYMLVYYLLQRESQIIVLMCIWHMIMHFHTGNVYCGAVPTVFVSILLTNKQPKNIKKKHPQLCFNSKHIGHLKYR